MVRLPHKETFDVDNDSFGSGKDKQPETTKDTKKKSKKKNDIFSIAKKKTGGGNPLLAALSSTM